MPKAAGSALRGTMFTDIVGSTDVAAELGDERWSRLIAAHHRIVRAQLKRHGGREIDTAGDGFFAVFERPADAIRCAFDAVADVQELGVDIRAGIHFGEVETDGGGARGVVVHTGARVMGQADAAEVLVTQTVRDLVAGARITFADRDEVTLKGVPGTWRLSTVTSVDERPRNAPLGANVARDRRGATGEGDPRARRRTPLVVLAVAAVLLVAGASVWLTRDEEPAGPPAPGSVARVADDGFTDVMSVGATPDVVAVGDGTVWVSDRTGQLYGVPVDGGDVSSRGTGGVPTGIAVEPGAVWITNAFGLAGDGATVAVTRLDIATGQLTEVFRVPAGSQAITIGAGAVWVASPHTGQVIRYDLVSRATETIDLASDGPVPRPDAIAFAAGDDEQVWVGDSDSARLFGIGVTAPFEVVTIEQPHPVDAVTAGGSEGEIWLASTGEDIVWSTTSTGEPRATVDVGRDGCDGPSAMAVTAGGLWVACRNSAEVVLVDPAAASVTRRLAVSGVPILGGAGPSIWVAVRER